MNRRTLLLTLFCLLLAPQRASAYDLRPDLWPEPMTTFSYSFLDAPWQASLRHAAKEWSLNTTFDFVENPNSERACDRTAQLLLNGAEFDSTLCDGASFGSTVVAVAHWDEVDGIRIASGIVFNSNRDWQLYDGLGRSQPDFRRIALHELGHVLGLGHESQRPSIMAPIIADIFHLTEDDIEGVAAGYPDGDPPEPGALSVSPSDDFLSSGDYQGPFSPTLKVYTLTNIGEKRIDFRTTRGATTWLQTPPGSGLLLGEDSVQINATLNGQIFTLQPGTYKGTLFFENQTNRLGTTTRPAELIVIPPPPPTVEFSANDDLVAVGESTTLTWTSTEAESCRASGALDFFGSKAESGSTTVTLHNHTTYTMTCDNVGNSVSESVTVNVIIPPRPTLEFSADDDIVAIGETTTLRWTSDGATSCQASGAPDFRGSRPLNGSASVVLEAHTTFAITCSNLGGSSSDTVEVQAFPRPRIDLSADPTVIGPGGESTLTWSVEAAFGCTGWNGTIPLMGSEVVQPSSSTTYELTCGNGVFTSTASVLVGVLPDPTVNLIADRTEIEAGETALLSWTSEGAGSCTAEDGWQGARPTEGSEEVTPAVTTTYTLSCENGVGEASDQVRIDVPAPSALTLQASVLLALGLLHRARSSRRRYFGRACTETRKKPERSSDPIC